MGTLSSLTHLRRHAWALPFALVLTTSAVIAQEPAYSFGMSIGGSGQETAAGIARDAQGNVYVTGRFTQTMDMDPGPGIATLTPGASGDAFVAKYDPTGAYVWAFQIAGAGGDLGDHLAIAASPSGATAVTGAFIGGADFDPGPGVTSLAPGGGFVARYTTDGALLGAFRLGINGALVWPTAVAIDAGGIVAVSGMFYGSVDFDPGTATTTLKSTKSSSAAGDLFVATYGSNGAFRWAFPIGSSSSEWCNAIAFAADGSLHVAGSFMGAVDFNPGASRNTLTAAANDGFVARYSAAGGYVWAARIGGAGDDEVSSLAVDAAGNVIAAGAFSGTIDLDPGAGTTSVSSAGSTDLFVAKYGATGGFRWGFRAGGTSSETCRSIAIGANDDVVIAGGFASSSIDMDPSAGTNALTRSGTLSNIYVAAYDAAGAARWAFALGGPAASVVSHGGALVCDGAGGVGLYAMHKGIDLDPSAGDASVPSLGQYDLIFAWYAPSLMPKVGLRRVDERGPVLR